MLIRFRVLEIYISSLLLLLSLLLSCHFLCRPVSSALLFLIYYLNRLVPLLLPVYSRGPFSAYPEIDILNIRIVEVSRGRIWLLLLYILRCLIGLNRGRALLV
jgi:hypothetical protein